MEAFFLFCNVQTECEGTALPLTCRLYPNAPAMCLDNMFGNRQPNARAATRIARAGSTRPETP